MADRALVTGADKGLGFSLAKAFVGAGFQVFAGQFVEGSPIEALAADHPEQLMAIPLDVTDADSVREAAERVSEHTSALDVLINNAGICLDYAVKLEDTDLDDAFRMMDVNAFGPLRVVLQFLPLLRRGERKVIVNVSSEAGSVGDCTRDFRCAYGMSKAALNMESKMILNRLGPEGFRVLAVDPGWMRTDMGGPDADFHPDESAAAILKLVMDEAAAGDALYVSRDGRPMNF
jgi:NAD(P)-dependent dehydrogenase (short-subunit alcohol dehydrogenase family)